MLIPIRCFTCGKVLADKYDYYLKEVQILKNNKQSADKEAALNNSHKKDAKETKEASEEYKHFEALRTGVILDKMGLNRYCCRRHMLGTVDLMDTI
jgi:DNA-directed RNA polymerase subunit N (RpoN/RPB10)